MALCYPSTTDWGCITTEEFEALDPDQKERAEKFAWQALQRLTGGRLSICPVALRPCAARLGLRGPWDTTGAIGPAYGPYISNGQWYNACGCTSSIGCTCDGRHTLRLPGEASGPVTVRIDGATLDPSAYRLDNAGYLTRMDGEVWPMNQDMTAPPTDPNTFEVTYYPGVGPDEQLDYAAGLLALEWIKACNGKDCQLPSGVTQIVRQGISMSIPAGVFDNGLSGIREVDAITAVYNPNRLKTPPRVLTPSKMRGRVRTA